jgi:hypothetical protein
LNTFIEAGNGDKTSIRAGISVGLADGTNGEGTRSNPQGVFRPDEGTPTIFRSPTGLAFTPSNASVIWSADISEPVETFVGGSLLDTGFDLTGVSVNNTPIAFDAPISLRNVNSGGIKFGQLVQLELGPGFQPITVHAEDESGLSTELTNTVEVRQDTPPSIASFTPADGARISATQLDAQGRLVFEAEIEDAEANLTGVTSNSTVIAFRSAAEKDGTNLAGIFSPPLKEGEPAIYGAVFFAQVAITVLGDGTDFVFKVDLSVTSASGLPTNQRHTITIVSE